MDQHSKEFLLIGIVLALTLLAYFCLPRSGGTGSQNAERLLTGILGAFMVLGGTAKLFEPFASMFANQIALSQLPVPRLSAIAGQAGEISSGMLLLTFFSSGRKFAGALGNKLFSLTNLSIVVIMLVAAYVHLHPDGPAETLPFQSKPPVLTVIVMLLALLNLVLHRYNKRALARFTQECKPVVGRMTDANISALGRSSNSVKESP